METFIIGRQAYIAYVIRMALFGMCRFSVFRI